MRHDQLKEGNIVVFKMYSDICKEEVFQDGNVISVLSDRNEVSVTYLEGYKSRNDNIHYDKMVAKWDINGKYMTFGNISGNSILIED